MRESRSSGSVEGVMSNRDPYSDFIYLGWQKLSAHVLRTNLICDDHR